MTQIIRNKDVRKNCVDVEKVRLDTLSEPEREEIYVISEPIESKKLTKKLLKYFNKNNAKYHQELLHINRVNHKMVTRNWYRYLKY